MSIYLWLDLLISIMFCFGRGENPYSVKYYCNCQAARHVRVCVWTEGWSDWRGKERSCAECAHTRWILQSTLLHHKHIQNTCIHVHLLRLNAHASDSLLTLKTNVQSLPASLNRVQRNRCFGNASLIPAKENAPNKNIYIQEEAVRPIYSLLVPTSSLISELC